MYALMALWYAARAGICATGGYFYLCPACYRDTIEAADSQPAAALPH